VRRPLFSEGAGVTPRSRPAIASIIALAAVGALAVGIWFVASERAETVEPRAAKPADASEAAPAVLPVPIDAAAPQSIVAAPVEAEAHSGVVAADSAAAEPAATAADGGTRPVTVIVVDGKGHTVRDAVVEVFIPPEDEDMAGFIKRMMAKGVEGTTLAAARHVSAMQAERDHDPTWEPPALTLTTDADGSASGLVSPKRALLVATHPALGSSGVVTLESADAGAVPSSLRLVLSPRETLSGRVLDVTGQPALGARVVFERAFLPDEDRGRPRTPKPIDVDAEGRFEVSVDTPFFAKVHGELGERQTPEKYAHASPGRSAPLDLRFAGGFAVTGLVTNPAGQPQAGADVEVAGFRVHAEPVETGSDGRFRLELAEPGHVVVFASVEGLVPDEGAGVTLSEIDPIADVTLRLIEPATITGRLQFTDGTPIAQASLVARPTTPKFGEGADMEAVRAWASRSADDREFAFELDDHARSDTDGRFTLRAIHPRYAVDISCYGHSTGSGDVEVKNVQPGAQDVLVVVERIEPGQDRLRGHVIDARSRAPIARCDLTCNEWSHGRVMPFGGEHVAVDDAAGHFEFSGLDPHQDYGVTVEAVGYPAMTLGPLRPSADGDVELVIGHAGSLRVVVMDAAGQAQPGASVQLMPGLGRSFAAVFSEVLTHDAGADGLLDWPDLKPGEYSIEAVAGKLRAPRVRIEVPPDQPAVVQLIVRAPEGGGTLEVTARDKADAPWPGKLVQAVLNVGNDAEPGLEPIHLGRTDADGRLLLEGLTPGDYIVSMRDAGMIVPLRSVTVDSEGKASVELRPKP
jgi:hypothetical protein